MASGIARIGRRAALAAITLVLACGLPVLAGKAAAQPLRVSADSYPVAYFAERLGVAAVDVSLPVPPGIDPATWSPAAEDIAAFQSADLILLNGAGLAQWLAVATLPRGKIFDSAAAFEDRFIAIEGLTHSHGPEGEHTHAAAAPFTWLDFTLALRQANAIAAELTGRLPNEAATIEANRTALVSDLAALNAEGIRLGVLAAGRPILASHPVYQYLRRGYGLNLESMHWEPGETPPPEELAALDALLAEHPATVMIWEGEPSPETAAQLAERGIASVVFDTAANRPAEGDFLSVMQANLARLRAALGGS